MKSLSEDQPTFSVITICRNDLNGLKTTRRSVQSQVFTSFEHVIVDGASTDGTYEWLISTQTGAPKLEWTSEPDAGIYDAMNKGVQRSRGTLLLFLNSGDTFHSDDSLRMIYANYVETQFDWAVGTSRMVNGDREVVGTHAPLAVKYPIFRLGLKTLPHQSTVMRSALFTALTGYDLNFGLFADQELMYRVHQDVGAPERLGFVVADCDANGLTSHQPPESFVRQMAEIRQAHSDVLAGAPIIDKLLTYFMARLLRTYVTFSRRQQHS